MQPLSVDQTHAGEKPEPLRGKGEGYDSKAHCAVVTVGIVHRGSGGPLWVGSEAGGARHGTRVEERVPRLWKPLFDDGSWDWRSQRRYYRSRKPAVLGDQYPNYVHYLQQEEGQDAACAMGRHEIWLGAVESRAKGPRCSAATGSIGVRVLMKPFSSLT